MKSTHAARCDLNTAVNAARAFAQLTKDYFSQVPRDPKAAEIFVGRTRGAFTAATTNIALSVELLLKAEAVLHKMTVLHTHDLRQLFDHLPREAQDRIEKNYEARVPSAIAGFGGMQIAVTTTPIPPTEAELSSARQSLVSVKDLKSLLSAERDAFETWRYLFAEGHVGRVAVFVSYFRRLEAVAEVLEADIRNVADATKA